MSMAAVKKLPSERPAPPPTPSEVMLIYRAQSLLHGPYVDRDGRSYDFTAFTVEQAKDIIEWAARNPT